METKQLKRIADALEEILRLVKKDMAEMKDKETKQTPGFSDNQDDWQIVRNGIDFFRRYFAKEYMVLLD